MSQYHRDAPSVIDLDPPLGALEIVAFAGIPANENMARGQVRAGPKPPRFNIAAAAFLSGMAAALVIACVGQIFGISG